MKKTVFISIIAIASAIQVPNTWNDPFFTTVTVKKYSPSGTRTAENFSDTKKIITKPDVILNNSGWTEQARIPKTTSKYYKKPIYSKKQKFLKPKKYVPQNYKTAAPYITYEKSENTPNTFYVPPRLLDTFSNAYPHIEKDKPSISPIIHQSKQSDPHSPTFDNFFNLPTNYKTESNFLPSKEKSNFPTNNLNKYVPSENIQYFEAEKSEDVALNQPFQEVRVPIKQKTVNKISEYYSPYQNKANDVKQDDQNYQSHLYKNYRDDKTFEPENNSEKYNIKEQDPKFVREEQAPISSHEYPADIPTRPIYPGEGQWARPGLKHKPFISKQTYDSLKDDKVKPDGYNTFIKGQELFDDTGNRFSQFFRSFPEQHKLSSFIEQKPFNLTNSLNTEKHLEQENEETKIKSKEEDEEEDEFVPTRLYAQVRATEDTEYLPQEYADDGKLREAIKESKIHTVYTEEGYEDSAYDHAGREKEAENAEGFEDLQREKEEKKEKKVPESKLNLHIPKFQRTKYSHGDELLSDEEIEKIKQEQLGLVDTETAGTQFKDIPINGNEENKEDKEDFNRYTDEYTTPETIKANKNNNNNFMSTKEEKTMTTKEKNDGDTETEIFSKVKIILQPNNSSKSENYIKVYPKVYKTIHRKKPKISDEKSENEESYYDNKNNSKNLNGIFIEEILNTTNTPFTKLPSIELQEPSEEIPITTLPTTAIPKPSLSKTDSNEALESITKEFLKINKRVKRFANDFSDLRIEDDFVPKINHKFGETIDIKKIKYPYYENYKLQGLNPNSPLRYSENIKQRPNKTGKKMVFYEQAERTVPCPEVEENINPIPERVRNAETKRIEENHHDDDTDEYNNEDSESNKDKIDNINEKEKDNRKKRDIQELPKTPRLSGLGDRIDCLKTRFFGKNPLDSPIFDEKTVGTVEPIFKELRKRNINIEGISKGLYKLKNNNQNKFISNFKSITVDKEKVDKNVNRIDETDNNDDKLSSQSSTNNENLGEKKQQNLKSPKKTINSIQIGQVETTTPTISLLTTPGYTIKLKPKHIYHQIKLLEFLPNQEEPINTKSPSELSDVTSSNSREFKALDEDNLTYEPSMDNPMLPDPEELRRRRKIRRKRPPFQIFDINKYLPTTPQPIFKLSIPLRENQVTTPSGFFQTTPPPVLNGVRKIHNIQIFDVNKFVPTTPYPLYKEVVTASTVLPKYKVSSEVFYKDDIKPNEQLHVFTDILNNIKNSSQEQNIDSSIESSEPVSVTFNSKQKLYNLIKPNEMANNQDSYLKAYGDQEIDMSYVDKIKTSTTLPPSTYRGRIRYKKRITPEPTTFPLNSIISNDLDHKLKMYMAFLESKKQQKFESTNNKEDYGYTIPVREENNDYLEKTTKVMGLMPPGTQFYKTIHHPKRDNSHQINSNQINKVNKYFVVGMKPPPHQKTVMYSDFLNNNNLIKKKISLHRGKRSSSYASFSRNRGQQEAELEKTNVPDNDDDYVPHRPKNYYFDEKTGKIVYLTTKKPAEEEEAEEEIEYEEIIEEPPATTSKSKQNPIFATATPPPEGKSFIDFVLKVKQNANYKLIPDPTTTEKGSKPVTEKSTATLKPESTTPPEFFNILTKVRQSSQYKLIKDEVKQNKEKIITEAPEQLVDAEEDENEDDGVPSGNIKNSPGGQNQDINDYFGIFDVTDFIPKIKNYLPKTSYDTSKYKTIERPTIKPTPATEDESELDEKNESRYLPQHMSAQNIPQITSQKPFLIITEEVNSDLDSLNEATVTKQTEEIPITIKRRRSTTSTTTVSTPSSTDPPTTKLSLLRRRRPTTLRSTRTTISITSTTPRSLTTSTESDSHDGKIRRNFRRRPTPQKKSHTTPKYIDEEQDDTTKLVKRRSDILQRISTESPTTDSNKFVEAFKKFHRNKKRGNSNKKVEATSEELKLVKNLTNHPKVIVEPINRDVEIVSKYDKTRRHGGNYRKVEENEEEENIEDIIHYQNNEEDVEDVSEALDDKALKISLLPKLEDLEELEDTEQTNSDKYRQEISLPDKKSKESVRNKPKKTDKNQRGKYITESTLVRLTDVVPKPDAFYNDPSLPRSVNMLEAVTKLSSDEIMDILSSTSSSEISEKNIETVTKTLL